MSQVCLFVVQGVLFLQIKSFFNNEIFQKKKELFMKEEEKDLKKALENIGEGLCIPKKRFKKEKRVKFICPNCSHNKYYRVEEYQEIYGPGAYLATLLYRCRGCSVRFKDPKKFGR